jgi:hypothetical protein
LSGRFSCESQSIGSSLRALHWIVWFVFIQFEILINKTMNEFDVSTFLEYWSEKLGNYLKLPWLKFV